MKISGAIIQNSKIRVNTEKDFQATYKGKFICISTDHGYGKARYDHLKRFSIDVKDIKTGMWDVQSYQDLHTIRDAVRYALHGACLLDKNS